MYGVAETDVLEPPFQIAVAASEPMLAYNETLHLYLAGYGVSEQKQTIERQMLFARLLGEDVITMTPPFEVLEDKKDIFGGNYPTFVTGDIVAEPEGGKFYLVWEQRNNNVPCVDPDWATPCDLDWNGAITTGESKVYVFYFDFVPSN